MPEKTLGEKLRTLRQNSGFKQQDIANILNCSRSTYTYYETGKTTPSISVLKVLAHIYNVPLLDLLDDEERPKPLHDSGKRPYKGPEPFDRIKYIYDLSPEERRLVGMYRTRSMQEKEEIYSFVEQYLRKKK